MSQEFEDVNLGTQITVALNRLKARDLTALTKSSSQTQYPVSPIDGQMFCHLGNLEMYLRIGSSWTRLWGWKNYLPPFTASYIESHFQSLSDELTDISRRGVVPFNFLASPYIPFNVSTAVSVFGCVSANAMRSYLGIGELGTYIGNQITNSQIQDGTLEARKFAFDFNTDIPRAMRTGDIKWTFNPSVDKTRFLVCDGKTIGSSQSNANHKGETYYNLFRELGGSDSDWATGKVVYLPDYTKQNTLISNSVSEKQVAFDSVLTMSLVGQAGLANYIQFTAVGNGNIDVEIIGAGGGGSLAAGYSDSYGWQQAVASGGGGGWFKGTVTVQQGDVITLRVGSEGITNAINESYSYINAMRGSAGGESSLSTNGEKLVSCEGGSGGYSYAFSHKKAGYGFGGVGGSGGSVTTSVSGEFRSGYSGTWDARVAYGACCGHGGQVDGSKYYAGNEEFVSPSKVKSGVGAGVSVGTAVSNCSNGYVRVKDVDGILQSAGNPNQATRRIETISALCVIKV